MKSETSTEKRLLPQGVMFNAYPDSIGRRLSDTVDLLERPELADAFSLFYILPTFFNSDLDRGFSVIDYDLNRELVSNEDLERLTRLGIMLKFDLVLNHLSVGSFQFQDILRHGDASAYKNFFIDWNEFWAGEGEPGADGYLIPRRAHLEKLFMRKPGLPILKVRFPDGSERPYWNTFYQEISYPELTPETVLGVAGIEPGQAAAVAARVNRALQTGMAPNEIELGEFERHRDEIVALVEGSRRYLGQMDLNAGSEQVWAFYDQTLAKLRGYGARMIRLDAFAYLHKQPGEANFFNKPGTWEYLERLKQMAVKHDLILLPEIHSQYGQGLHREVADEGFPIYDFFFPGLVIDALDRGTASHLLRWLQELQIRGISTVNMLGCHDGIPVLDLKGGIGNGEAQGGLLSEEEIDAVVERIIQRGGRVKDLYGPDGKKIAYYQVNATFFSALGEDERKMRLARAIQMFMPGIPQVWYLDLFAGPNDYAAADRGGTGGHKEINRTTLGPEDIERGLQRAVVRDQLELIRLRNTLPAFGGELQVGPADDHRLRLTWSLERSRASLDADLRALDFKIEYTDRQGVAGSFAYGR
ncbi:MAG: glycosidase [Gammaproteobacteria bacterium]|nr:glycosidase [Gammaproteobacteria bacterium]